MKIRQTLLSVVPFLSLACIAVSSAVVADAFVAAGDEEVLAYESIDNYDNWIASWGQQGHMYLHYNRGEKATAADYAQYALWLWQHAPKDIGGSLWAYGGSTTVGSITLDPMTTAFMTGAEVGKSGGDTWIDQYGAIIDVDLTANPVKPGKVVSGANAGDASLAGATELGFLLVQEESMGGTTHWSSDGGKNTYLEHIDQAPKTNGAIHVYVSTGDLDSYAYESSKAKAAAINPTTADTSGTYKSKITEGLVDRMTPANSNSPTISPTSDSFKSLGVGYQIFVASFRDSNGDGLGDIRGIINSLDYLQDMGAQVLWLTPIQKSDSYHGYDISDYYAVDPKFGTLDDYRELLYKAHKKGMKVLMDLVLNHTSKSNVWFKNSQWAKTSVDENGNTIEWRNVYHWKYKDQTVNKYKPSAGDWSESITVETDAHSDNPSWYKDGLSNYYYYGKFGSGMPEINYEYQPTRDLVKNMAKYWLSFGLDGFRLDAVKHIYMKDEVENTGNDIIIKDVGKRTYFDTEKGSNQTVNFDYSSDLNKNVTWWKEFATDLKKVYPECFLVGENFDGYGNRTAPYYQALDSQFGFNHFYHIAQNLIGYGPGSYTSEMSENDAITGKSGTYWIGDVQQADLPGGYRSDFIDGAFTSNHDVMRAMNHFNWTEKDYKKDDDGNYVLDKDGHKIEVGTLDNPSVTSNAQTIGKAKLAAAMTILSPGLSWIYYGDELGMTSNTDQHIAKYSNKNNEDIWYRQPYKWGGDAASQTVDYSAGGYKIEWDDNNKNNVQDTKAQLEDPNSMLNYYTALAKLKALYPKNAKVKIENPGNVLLLTVTGDDAHMLKIFISCAWDGASCNIYGIDGLTKFDKDNGAFGTVGNVMNQSTPIGTIGAWYK